MKFIRTLPFLVISCLIVLLSGCDLLDSINTVDEVKKRNEERNQEVQAEAENGTSFFGGLFDNDDTASENDSNTTVTDSPSTSKEVANEPIDNGSSEFSAIFEATWERTTDGDTIVIDSEERGTETVRLMLVDTPESKHMEMKPQLYGVFASRYTEKLNKENKNVIVKVGNPSHDKYNRLLAYVFLENGEMLNEHLVEVGFARVAYISPPNTQYLTQLREAEQRAKADKKLIWSVDGFVTDKGFNMDVVTNDDYSKATEQTRQYR